MKIIKNIAAGIIAASFLFQTVCAAETLNISIDKDTVIKETMGYGVGHEWVPNTFHSFMGEGAAKITPEDIEKIEKQTGYYFDFVRHSGLTSVRYNWKDAIGYLYNRPTPEGTQGLYNMAPHVIGVPDILKAISYSGGKDKKFIFTIGMANDREEDIADLAEFFYGDGTVNYNGGVNWAEYRIKFYGLKEPIEIFAWELGNEYDLSTEVSNFINDGDYVKQCMKYISAIRSINKDAKISVCATMDPWRLLNRSNRWTIKGLNDLAPYLDYVSLHGYHSYGATHEEVQAMKELADEAARVSGGRIRVIDTEYNQKSAIKVENPDPNYPGYGRAFYYAGATALAEYLSRVSNLKGYAAGTLFSYAIDKTFSMFFQNPKTLEISLNPVGRVQKMFKDYCNGKVVKVNLDGFEDITKPTNVASAAFLQDDRTINLILVNTTKEDEFVINFDKKYQLLEQQRIYSVNGWEAFGCDYDYVREDIDTYTSVDVIDTYELRKNHIVRIKLREVE